MKAEPPNQSHGVPAARPSPVRGLAPIVRITLRPWRETDLAPYAAMNADAGVMRFFPRPLTFAESKESFTRLQRAIAERGWGLWVVEVDGDFAGFTGLSEPRFTAPFTPCVEIGWRLRREYWGRSIAYAAALAAQAFGFQKLRLAEIVSFTAVTNLPSRRLMERLGFVRKEREDFLHPSLPEDSPLRLHVLYRRSREAFEHASEAPTARRSDAPTLPIATIVNAGQVQT